MRALLREQGLEDAVEVDSAGTGAWHLGDPPDARATAAAQARGIALAGAARQVAPADFAGYDLILAADRQQPARPGGGPARRRAGAAAPAAGVRPGLRRRAGPRRPGSLLRRRRRLRARPRPRRRGLPRPARPAARRRPGVKAPQAAASALGQPLARAERVAGGDINDAWRIELADGTRAFVKARAGAQPGEYATEAAGLRWLGAARDGLPVPAVLAAGDGFLALEWLDEGRLGAAGEEALGRGLAHLHAAGAPAFGAPPPGAPFGRPAARDDRAAGRDGGRLAVVLRRAPAGAAGPRGRAARGAAAGRAGGGGGGDGARGGARRAARAAGAAARRPLERERARRRATGARG